MSEDLSSKDLLIRLLGIHDIHAYERVKRLSMQLGHELAATLLYRVGGRPALIGEECDGITELGRWEFALQQNTKNSAGKRHDEMRCPGRCVQILGRPQSGWMSAGDFLALHAVAPGELLPLIDATLDRMEVYEQMRLKI